MSPHQETHEATMNVCQNCLGLDHACQSLNNSALTARFSPRKRLSAIDALLPPAATSGAEEEREWGDVASAPPLASWGSQMDLFEVS